MASSLTLKDYSTFVKNMVEYVIANQSTVSDLSPGSVLRSIIEALGLSLEEITTGTYLGFKRQFDTLPSDIYNFIKKAGLQASGHVVFSRTGTTGDVTIPVGTKVATSSGLIFITSAVGTIANGNTASGSIVVAAEKVGTVYNVLASTVIVMTDSVTGVESVTNANAMVGGIDVESDYSFKSRFQAYIEGLAGSNLAGLKAGALSVNGITSASVVELIPAVANVNVNVYVDNGLSTGTPSATIAEVQSVIDGDGTQANPGYRAAGVNVVVLSPSIVTQNIVGTVIVANTNVDATEVGNNVNQAVLDYVNNLGVGENIIRFKIIDAIMGIYGVTDCTLTTPSGNTTIGSTQVGRIGTITMPTA
jgi:uncharacterized phage protein gp47/JayE